MFLDMIFSLLPSSRKEVGLRECRAVSACVLFQLLNYLAHYNDIWSERDAVGGHPNITLFNFVW